ncbi:MAG: GNAT family N-acetyltransferase [Reichenbachiella sp.]|uniref:GNAT family N-acetyltransferase n=1 Tax=Reichenbachiella sp. TaxID=2184521 RepID=UPI0032656D9B
MKNTITRIETPNLILRLFVPEEAQLLKERLDDNLEIMMPWIPWAKDEPEPVDKKRERIRSWIGDFFSNKEYAYGVFEKESGDFVGSSNLFGRRGKGTTEIGYWMDHLQTGKGYATEVTYALTKLSFEHMGIEKVLLYIDERNAASQRIPAKLGFTHEYTYRELAKDENGDRLKFQVWVMFAEEFKKVDKFESVNFKTTGIWN